jgi:rubredoxin
MPEPRIVFVCTVCGYTYNPDKGDPDIDIDPGTDFESLPENFTCPNCGSDKEEFDEEEA